MATLVTCPTCGRDAAIEATMVESGWWSAEASCKGDCSVRVVCGGKTKGEAVESVTKAWNTRNS